MSNETNATELSVDEIAAENGCEEAKQVLADWENKGANNGEA